MEELNRKILIFTSREICYNSNTFFAYQMGEAFEKLGYSVLYCFFTKEDDFDLVLKPYLGKKYRLILDFNSLLPQLEKEDGTPVLDLLEGPFYDYILDHPLFHYNSLSVKAKDFHAILLDEAQEKYVKKYHPYVKTTRTMPLSASLAITKEKRAERADSVLFIGSYDSEERLLQYIKQAPQALSAMMQAVLELRIEEPTIPMEIAFRRVLEDMGLDMEKERFALTMNQMYPVDAFIRNYWRKKAITCLLKEHIPVRIVGNGWNSLPHSMNPASYGKRR